MIAIQELLFNRGLCKDTKAKLVRHKDRRFDLYNIYRYERQRFLRYQEQQGSNVFDDVDCIVSFVGEEGTLARFIGVYRIVERIVHEQPQMSVDGGAFRYEYRMEEVSGFEDMKERVIVSWGKTAIQWEQWIYNQKEIVEIQPGLHYKQFTDYFDFILDYKELHEIVTHGYADWKRMLSATKGIYLISDAETGKLYVGSAYGENGIWGRWCVYISTGGHGGNKTLKELVEQDPSYSNNFRFSILMLLPKTVTADQAINKEKLFKAKLGTNSFGLNNN